MRRILVLSFLLLSTACAAESETPAAASPIAADPTQVLQLSGMVTRVHAKTMAALTSGAATRGKTLQSPLGFQAVGLLSPLSVATTACKPGVTSTCADNICTSREDFSGCSDVNGIIERRFEGNFTDGTYKLTVAYNSYTEGVTTDASFLSLDGTAFATGRIGEASLELTLYTDLKVQYRDETGLITKAWTGVLETVARDGKVTLDGHEKLGDRLVRFWMVVFDGKCKLGPTEGNIGLQLPDGNSNLNIIRCGEGVLTGEGDAPGIAVNPADFREDWRGIESAGDVTQATQAAELLLGNWYVKYERLESDTIIILGGEAWISITGGAAQTYTLEYDELVDVNDDGNYTSEGDLKSRVVGSVHAANGTITVNTIDVKTWEYSVTDGMYKPTENPGEHVMAWGYNLIEAETMLWTIEHRNCFGATFSRDYTIIRQ